MGIRDLAKRLTASIDEIDAARLQTRFSGLQLTPIGEMPLRRPIRIGGEVSRIRSTPRSGVPAFEIVISDGTGDATAVFTGRRNVGGIEHGRGILLEGVASVDRGRPVLVNPAYTLLP
ncbi:MAG: hypothetical protein MUE78_05850 [Ilumatobacteraceae bacterium]|jgi:hypothetical protein|nr:hypothetical protein [Ilumatobacteraceae bacterium]